MDTEKIDNIAEKLNNMFVDKYEIIKKSVIDINKKLKELNVDFEYNYDDFCLEYKKEMIDALSHNPDIEINDVTMFMLSHSILLKMLSGKKTFFTSKPVDPEESTSKDIFL